MKKDTALDECVAYFKSDPGFKKVFEQMRKKYVSLGAIGGTLPLRELDTREKQAVSGFLRKDYLSHAGTALRFSDFQKALDSTKFKGIRMEDVLGEYFKEELIPNSQLRSLYEENRNRFFQALSESFDMTHGGAWLEAALSLRDHGYKTMMQRYDQDPDSLSYEISVVCTAINSLPYLRNEKIRLPVFASSAAADPHALDCDTACGQLFMPALAFHMGCPKPKGARERAELLYKAGILIDEVSNMVLCCGLTAWDNEGRTHPGWKGFSDGCEPLQVTLLNLSRLSKISAPSGRVYVVENPSVFASVLDRAGNSDKAEVRPVSIVCTYGQINLAGLVLLDLLAAGRCEIRYSGDFDPEGIKIADRLRSRYGDMLKLWRYSVEDYLSALSDRTANAARLRQLDGVGSPQLLPLVRAVKERRLCGYQELILDKLMQDVFEEEN